jgi:UDP-glucuronate decarboxylase
MKTLLDIPTGDLDAIIDQASQSFYSLNNGSLLLTGATGKIGKWLLASAIHAIREFDLTLQLVVPSRNPQAFLDRYGPECNDPSIRIVAADLGVHDFSKSAFTHVIHGAVDNRKILHRHDVGAELLKSTRSISRLCVGQEVSKVLFLSSGSVYETVHSNSPLLETDVRLPQEAPDFPVYRTAKQYSETVFKEIGAVIARGFSFVGPHFPLDTHFAIGNFISASLRKEPIVVTGDGGDLRSYMYGSDLASWLWTILVKGEPGIAYNVGSDKGLSINSLAQLVARTLENPADIRILNEDNLSQRRYYVPNIQKARGLGLELKIDLESAIVKTAQWATKHPAIA